MGADKNYPYFSIVSPVYKAAPLLPELVRRIKASVAPLGKPFEIILVDDFSPDDSWAVLNELRRAEPTLRILQLSRNFGQHHAISAGLERARGEWIVVMDCDLQDRPEEIPNLHRAAAEGDFDMVLAFRKNRQDSLRKRLSSFVFYRFLSYLCDEEISEGIANFGIYKKQVIEAINRLQESSRYFPVFVQWVGFKKKVLEVQHAARPEGASSYNFKNSLRLALNIILASSDKPLRIIVKFGLSVAASSFLYASYILYEVFTDQVTAKGWASLIISVWFWGGLLMSTVGIVGLYVGRSFEEGKSRPLYLVREDISS